MTSHQRAVWPVVLDPITGYARDVLARRIERLKGAIPHALPKARGIDETGPSAPPTYLLRRGEYGARGPEVAPAFPAVRIADAPAASNFLGIPEVGLSLRRRPSAHITH